jgi:hypothetical protein
MPSRKSVSLAAMLLAVAADCWKEPRLGSLARGSTGGNAKACQNVSPNEQRAAVDALWYRESGGYYGCRSRIRVMVIGEANDAFGNNAA